jgi:DNA-binding NarL/FixJ family response regulator
MLKHQAHPSNSTRDERLELTRRELDVIRLIRDGLNKREIGERLGITEYTVKRHVVNALKVADCTNSVQLVMYCLRSGAIRLWDGEDVTRG